ncbi:MAG: ParA family protein [Peptostreptococcaceae bacterium]|jgi:hypothetical protein|nr:ParA family protein [Peptostreptococcaceae bacterium]
MNIFVGDKRVGKTFISKYLSLYLSDYDKKVALIDFNNSSDLFDFFKTSNSYDNSYNDFCDILKKPLLIYKNIDIYTSKKLNNKDFSRVFELYKNFKSKYDYIIFDCSFENFKKLLINKKNFFQKEEFNIKIHLILDQRVISKELREIALYKKFDSIIFNKYIKSRFDDKKLLNMLNLELSDSTKLFYLNYDLLNEQEDLNNYFKNRELTKFNKELKKELNLYSYQILNFKFNKKSIFNIF